MPQRKPRILRQRRGGGYSKVLMVKLLQRDNGPVQGKQQEMIPERPSIDLMASSMGEMLKDAQELQSGAAGDSPQWESTGLPCVRSCLDSVSSSTK